MYGQSMLLLSLGGLTSGSDVIVRMKADTSAALGALGPQRATREGVRAALSTHAISTQEDLLNSLNQQNARVQSFWIENAIAVSGASAGLVDALRSHPDVATVEEERSIRLPRLEKTEEATEAAPQGNIAELNTQALWDAGVYGQGVVVANIDSGVRWSHESLRDNYRGFGDGTGQVNHDYAMWDVNSSIYTPEGVDIFGHGSHTMGTLAGSGPQSIGMAPRAEWISAKAFNWDGESKESDLLSAAQWVMCPTKYDHSGEDCGKGADIVSCSFGNSANLTWFNPSVKAWRTAGMLPVFSSGNADNAMQCGSVFEPAAYELSIAVGGVNGKRIYRPSGKGPGDGGNVKPDFVAPAVSVNSICSAADTGKSGYMRLSGTSMATPHVAGALALVLSAGRQSNESFAAEDALAALRATAQKDQKQPRTAAAKCGNTAWNEFPNNIYGWGEPDVCAAAGKCGSVVV